MHITRRSPELFKGSQIFPRFAAKPPEKLKSLQLGPRAKRGGAASWNSPALAGLLALEGELTTARFLGGEGVEAAPASSPSSAEQRQLLRFGSRRGGRRGSPTSES
jgi:hypothetical protein